MSGVGEVGSTLLCDVAEVDSVEEKLQRARCHGWYSRALRRVEDSDPVTSCPCGVCSYTIGERFSLWPEGDFSRHVKDLGPGWTLYFDFARKMMQCLILFFTLYLGVLSFYLSQSHIRCWSVPMVSPDWLPGDNFTEMQHISGWMGSAGNVGPKAHNFFLGGYWSAPLIDVQSQNELLQGLFRPIRDESDKRASETDIVRVTGNLEYNGLYVRQIVKKLDKPIFVRVHDKDHYYFSFSKKGWTLQKRGGEVLPAIDSGPKTVDPSKAGWQGLSVTPLLDTHVRLGEKGQTMVRWNTTPFAPESWVIYKNTPTKEDDQGYFAKFLLAVEVRVENKDLCGTYFQHANDKRKFTNPSERDAELRLMTDPDRWVLIENAKKKYVSDELEVNRFDDLPIQVRTWSTECCMNEKCEKRETVEVHVYSCDVEKKDIGFTYPWVIFYQYICLLVLIFGIQWYRGRQNEIIEEVDQCSTTPDDFTVCVRGFPDDITEKKVREYFEGTLPNLKADDIYHVCLLYDIRTINRLLAQLPEVHNRQQVLEKTLRDSDDLSSRQVIEQELAKLTKAEEHLQSQLKSWKPRVTGALVIFRHVRTAYECAAYFYSSPMKRFFVRFGWFLRCLIYTRRRRGAHVDHGFYQNQLLTVQRAPDPSDIRWEHEGCSSCAKTFRRLLLHVLLWLLLACCVWASYYFAHRSLASPGNLMLRLTASCVMVVSNSMFGAIVSYTIPFGVYRTMSKESSKQMLRIAIAQMINSLYIPFLVRYMIDVPNEVCREGASEDVERGNRDPVGTTHIFDNILAPLFAMVKQFNKCHNWYHSSGLVSVVFLFFLSSVVIIPLLNIFQPDLIMKWIWRQIWYIRRRSGNAAALTITQQELNRLHEGCEATLQYRFASMINVFFVALTFAPAFPLGLLFGAVTLLVVNWSDKLQLLYLAKNPHYSQGHVAIRAVNMIPYLCIPLPLIMCKLLSASVEDDDDASMMAKDFMFRSMIIVTAIIVCVNFSGQFAELVRKCVRGEKARRDYTMSEYWDRRTDDDEPYDLAKRNFKTTYAECNPAYKMGLVEDEHCDSTTTTSQA